MRVPGGHSPSPPHRDVLENVISDNNTIMLEMPSSGAPQNLTGMLSKVLTTICTSLLGSNTGNRFQVARMLILHLESFGARDKLRD